MDPSFWKKCKQKNGSSWSRTLMGSNWNSNKMFDFSLLNLQCYSILFNTTIHAYIFQYSNVIIRLIRLMKFLSSLFLTRNRNYESEVLMYTDIEFHCLLTSYQWIVFMEINRLRLIKRNQTKIFIYIFDFIMKKVENAFSKCK